MCLCLCLGVGVGVVCNESNGAAVLAWSLRVAKALNTVQYGTRRSRLERRWVTVRRLLCFVRRLSRRARSVAEIKSCSLWGVFIWSR